jgi:drug/metabolite transporter (DMT)-like permease
LLQAVAFALLAMVLFSGANITSRKGVRGLTPVTGLLISVAVGFLATLLAALSNLPPSLPLAPVLLMLLTGLFAPGLGRIMAISGIRRLGASLHVPLQASVHPALGVFGGPLLFGETLTAGRLLGVVAIVGGVWLLWLRADASSFPPPETEAETPAEPPVTPAPGADPRPRRSRVGWAVLLPVTAGVAYGAADLIRNQVLEGFDYPEFGAMAAMASGLLLWVPLATFNPSLRRQARWGAGKRWFVLNGLLSAAAVLSTMQALRVGDVSVVSPIFAAQPLAVLVMSRYLLREEETVTRPIVLGSLAVVTGVVLIVLS